MQPYWFSGDSGYTRAITEKVTGEGSVDFMADRISSDNSIDNQTVIAIRRMLSETDSAFYSNSSFGVH